MKIKFIKTRKDLSVWIIASIWLLVNLIGILTKGTGALIITNPAVLLVLSGWVIYTKRNPEVNKWLEERL